ncbi:prepilin peptidase [Paenibacillus sp.]|uniref:prepilin peptidase n=1 Tax=Paenibacillus sp. TaxID=58172 RepID=UPI002810B374|nr:prepilin peptidase [Paenibacillus sp.]
MTTVEIGLLLFTGLTFGWDLRARKIPNLLVGFGFLLAAALHVFSPDGSGWSLPALGAVAGLSCGLPLYFAGAIGAGDAKWFAAAGAFAGWKGAAAIACASVLAGGVAALCLLAASRSFRRRFAEVIAGCYVRTGWERFNVPEEGRTTLPFLLCAGPAVCGYVLMV